MQKLKVGLLKYESEVLVVYTILKAQNLTAPKLGLKNTIYR